MFAIKVRNKGKGEGKKRKQARDTKNIYTKYLYQGKYDISASVVRGTSFFSSVQITK